MAKVKTFRIQNGLAGVPDREIRNFISDCEKDAVVRVTTVFIPPIGQCDPRLTVIVTKLDDKDAAAPQTGDK